MHTAIRSWPDKIGEADWRSRLAMKIGEEGSKEEGRKEGGRKNNYDKI